MLCPTCRLPMHRLEFYGTEVDECRFCAGLWVDPGEAERLASLKIIPRRVLNPIPLDDRRQVAGEGERQCPRCGRLLEVLEVRGIRLDACLSCRGMWLDRGEFRRLVAGESASS